MMISHNTPSQAVIIQGTPEPTLYPPKGKKINTDQLNNGCLAVVVNYNRLINYEKGKSPSGRT